MKNTVRMEILLLALAAGLTGCRGAGSSTTPTAPSALAPAPAPSLILPLPPNDLFVFHESDFSTTDVRDARERIVQFTNGGDLIWTADGTRLHGFTMEPDSNHWGVPTYFIGGKICEQFCVFSIRFGTRDGQRRAYLTVDYGHSNPGTLVETEVKNGALAVTQTTLFPPGTPTLSGVVTEVTPAGKVPVAGASVARSVPAGWQYAETDQSGFYSMPGIIEGTAQVYISKDGYAQAATQLDVRNDLRFDVQLVRR